MGLHQLNDIVAQLSLKNDYLSSAFENSLICHFIIGKFL